MAPEELAEKESIVFCRSPACPLLHLANFADDAYSKVEAYCAAASGPHAPVRCWTVDRAGHDCVSADERLAALTALVTSLEGKGAPLALPAAMPLGTSVRFTIDGVRHHHPAPPPPEALRPQKRGVDWRVSVAVTDQTEGAVGLVVPEYVLDQLRVRAYNRSNHASAVRARFSVARDGDRARTDESATVQEVQQRPAPHPARGAPSAAHATGENPEPGTSHGQTGMFVVYLLGCDADHEWLPTEVRERGAWYAFEHPDGVLRVRACRRPSRAADELRVSKGDWVVLRAYEPPRARPMRRAHGLHSETIEGQAALRALPSPPLAPPPLAPTPAQPPLTALSSLAPLPVPSTTNGHPPPPPPPPPPLPPSRPSPPLPPPQPPPPPPPPAPPPPHHSHPRQGTGGGTSGSSSLAATLAARRALADMEGPPAATSSGEAAKRPIHLVSVSNQAQGQPGDRPRLLVIGPGSGERAWMSSGEVPSLPAGRQPSLAHVCWLSPFDVTIVDMAFEDGTRLVDSTNERATCNMRYLDDLSAQLPEALATISAAGRQPDVIVAGSRGGRVLKPLLEQPGTLHPATRLFYLNAFQGDDAVPRAAPAGGWTYPLMLVSGHDDADPVEASAYDKEHTPRKLAQYERLWADGCFQNRRHAGINHHHDIDLHAERRFLRYMDELLAM